MKRFYISSITLFMLIIVTFLSCRKDDSNVNGGNTPALINRSLRVLQSVPDSELRIAYTALSPSAKKAVWLAHIDTIIVKKEFDSAQISYIDTLRSYIAQYDFSIPNDTSNTVFFNSWRLAAMSVLSDEDMYLLAFTLFDSLSDEARVIYSGGGGFNPGVPGGPVILVTEEIVPVVLVIGLRV